MNEELRKKLAKWAGFWQGTHTVYSWKPKWNEGDKFWRYPTDSFQHKNLPDFTESLDACEGWLVPELLSRDYYIEIIWGEVDDATCHLHTNLDKPEFLAYGKTAAQALCSAIEQLIDRGE